MLTSAGVSVEAGPRWSNPSCQKCHNRGRNWCHCQITRCPFRHQQLWDSIRMTSDGSTHTTTSRNVRHRPGTKTAEAPIQIHLSYSPKHRRECLSRGNESFLRTQQTHISALSLAVLCALVFRFHLLLGLKTKIFIVCHHPCTRLLALLKFTFL